MPEVLVIRLKGAIHASGDIVTAEWLVIDEAGTHPGEVQSGPLTDAAILGAGRKQVVLIPGTDALLAEPVVPVKSGAKLVQVVPFALEEQLASDVDDLHFAVGKRDTRPGVPVAVVAHAHMEAWLAALRQAGLAPDAIYAETAVLPPTPNGVTLLVDHSRVYVRRAETPGAVLEVQPLIEALQLALASGDEAREHVTIYVGEDDYEQERDLLEGLREFTASLQLRLLPGGALPLLAATVAQSAPVNLLQGKYLVKNTLNISFAPWRYAALLAVIFFGVHLGIKGWQHLKYQRTEAQLDAAIADVYQEAMPGAPLPDPLQARKQMEARLAALRGGGPAGGLMAALSTLGEAVGQVPGTNIEAISYRDNITDLRVLTPSVDALDRIKQAAGQRGVAAEIQSATPRDSKTEARLQFKTPGA
jgi:general secretion pathway protein L